MNTATVRGRRASKESSPSISASAAVEALRRELVLREALRARWEMIVARGRA